MRIGLVRLLGALCCLTMLLLPAAPALADRFDPLLAGIQAFVQDDGAMHITEGLTFRENAGRSSIKKIGELYTPGHGTGGWLRAAEAVLRELGHEGVCVERQQGGAAYYLFADLQPRLLIRRCEYCQAELPLNEVLTECPRCGGSFAEAVERRALSEEGLYRMDQ